MTLEQFHKAYEIAGDLHRIKRIIENKEALEIEIKIPGYFLSYTNQSQEELQEMIDAEKSAIANMILLYLHKRHDELEKLLAEL